MIKKVKDNPVRHRNTTEEQCLTYYCSFVYIEGLLPTFERWFLLWFVFTTDKQKTKLETLTLL